MDKPRSYVNYILYMDRRIPPRIKSYDQKHYNKISKFNSNKQDNEIKKSHKEDARKKFNEYIMELISRENPDDHNDYGPYINSLFYCLYNGVGNIGNPVLKTLFIAILLASISNISGMPTTKEWNSLFDDKSSDTVPFRIKVALFIALKGLSPEEREYIFNTLKDYTIIYNPKLSAVMGVSCDKHIVVGPITERINPQILRHEAQHLSQISQRGCTNVVDLTALHQSMAYLETHLDEIISNLSPTEIIEIERDMCAIPVAITGHGDLNCDKKDIVFDAEKQEMRVSNEEKLKNRIKIFFYAIKMYKKNHIIEYEIPTNYLQYLPSSFLKYAVETSQGKPLITLYNDIIKTETKYWQDVGTEPKPFSSSAGRQVGFINNFGGAIINAVQTISNIGYGGHLGLR